MARRTGSLLALAGLAVLSASSFNPVAAQAGPDVIVGDLPNLQYFGVSGGIAAYSIATTSCNVGTAQLLWIQNDNRHPVIAQNLFLIRDGRFRQIGQSFLKHGFCALQQNICGPCQPAGSGCVSRLGVGCSDPYSSSLNGQQSNLGPRSQVNAWTGAFPYPFTAATVTNTTIDRRLQVSVDDLPPILPAQGSIYFAEGHYVAADDSAAGNQDNNASYRRVSFTSPSSFANVGTTQRQKPAILGWKDVDETVTVTQARVPNEGLFYIGAKVVNNGDGTYTYNYAVYNLNSHVSAASFSIPLGCGASVSDMGFSHPPSHSGEPYSNAAWAMTTNSVGSATWSTQSFAENPNANAIRWSTAYSFWFTSESAPVQGTATLGLFRQAGELTVGSIPVPGTGCRADWNTDGSVNSNDISAYLSAWLDSVQNGNTLADYDCDGVVNSNDISSFLTSWLNALAGGC